MQSPTEIAERDGQSWLKSVNANRFRLTVKRNYERIHTLMVRSANGRPHLLLLTDGSTEPAVLDSTESMKLSCRRDEVARKERGSIPRLSSITEEPATVRSKTGRLLHAHP